MFVFTLCVVIAGCTERKPDIRRVGQMTEIRPDMIERYRQLLTEMPSGIPESLKACNMTNYSVFLKELEDNRHVLFSYFEYTGGDYESERDILLNDQDVRKWCDIIGTECLADPPQEKKGEWWSDMKEVFYFEGMTGRTVDESKVERYGMVIGIRPGMILSYTLLHKHTWPEVLTKITEGNIRNYAIYLNEFDGRHYLFSYFEYVGDDFEADMALVDNDPATIAWMKFTDEVCQIPLSTRHDGEWWAAMERVFFHR